jgi:hypothetical protein
MAQRVTHLIDLVDGAKWEKTNECRHCGKRIPFDGDWTAYPVLATC